jgi:hypothetical protein
MKIDYRAARMRTHRRNIQRYGRLLATSLTDLERQYLHRQIAEEQAELERLAQAEHSGQQDRGASELQQGGLGTSPSNDLFPSLQKQNPA